MSLILFHHKCSAKFYFLVKLKILTGVESFSFGMWCLNLNASHCKPEIGQVFLKLFDRRSVSPMKY